MLRAAGLGKTGYRPGRTTRIFGYSVHIFHDDNNMIPVVFALLLCAVYVGSLYLIPESIKNLPRDNPTHVRDAKYLFIHSAIKTLLTLPPYNKLKINR